MSDQAPERPDPSQGNAPAPRPARVPGGPPVPPQGRVTGAPPARQPAPVPRAVPNPLSSPNGPVPPPPGARNGSPPKPPAPHSPAPPAGPSNGARPKAPTPKAPAPNGPGSNGLAPNGSGPKAPAPHSGPPSSPSLPGQPPRVAPRPRIGPSAAPNAAPGSPSALVGPPGGKPIARQFGQPVRPNRSLSEPDKPTRALPGRGGRSPEPSRPPGGTPQPSTQQPGAPHTNGHRPGEERSRALSRPAEPAGVELLGDRLAGWLASARALLAPPPPRPGSKTTQTRVPPGLGVLSLLAVAMVPGAGMAAGAITVAADAYCTYGSFCLYSGPNFTGDKVEYHHDQMFCQDGKPALDLRAVLPAGVRSVVNNTRTETSGQAVKFFSGGQHLVLSTVSPGREVTEMTANTSEAMQSLCVYPGR
ncbi:hypothetical protein GCM10023321_34180 [Pseudonocardia eucalypti]|uniref:Peptidase inhibitor family I36 n=1 Tax=Pseudonocardia eucalypti TaxID=648755 RepID=A0ABP9Q9D9_9PSEU|nr:hypothetical protein [Pseudonocardia eucalypti]